MKTVLLAVIIFICVVQSFGEIKVVEKRHTSTTELWSKVGLAWCDWNASNMWALAGNGWNEVSWSYTWSVWPNTATTEAGLDFVPMLWGPGFVADFQEALGAGVFTDRTAFLGFNEPDQQSQSNMAVSEAVSLWRQYIEPLKGEYGLRLGAPAVSNNGTWWLQNFMGACTGCTIDFIPLHWYGSSNVSFIEYVESIYAAYQLPIWITEWACNYGTCTESEVEAFMGSTVYWLTNDATYVERYAWFGAMQAVPSGVPTTDQLLTSNGQSATTLGLQYAYGY